MPRLQTTIKIYKLKRSVYNSLKFQAKCYLCGHHNMLCSDEELTSCEKCTHVVVRGEVQIGNICNDGLFFII
jgi:hypothetical protein